MEFVWLIVYPLYFTCIRFLLHPSYGDLITTITILIDFAPYFVFLVAEGHFLGLN